MMKLLSPLYGLMFPFGFAMVASFASAGDGAKGGSTTFLDFEKSATDKDAIPQELSMALQAMWHAKADQWDKSHDLAQNIKTPTGSWVHAFLHREEGDLVNAAYWYRQAGKSMPEGDTIAEEWSFIARELWQAERGILPGEEVFTSATGLVAMSKKSADNEEGVWDTVIRKNGKVVLTITNARPVSFGPDGDVLLLRHAAADDDSRHFLVKPRAAAKMPKSEKRIMIGGRFVTDHKWSDDGRTLTLVSVMDGVTTQNEEIIVNNHLSPK